MIPEETKTTIQTESDEKQDFPLVARSRSVPIMISFLLERYRHLFLLMASYNCWCSGKSSRSPHILPPTNLASKCFSLYYWPPSFFLWRLDNSTILYVNLEFLKVHMYLSNLSDKLGKLCNNFLVTIQLLEYPILPSVTQNVSRFISLDIFRLVVGIAVRSG